MRRSGSCTWATDPQVRAHALALCGATGKRTTFVETDLPDPDAVVSTLRVPGGCWTSTGPVAVLFGARDCSSWRTATTRTESCGTVMQAMAPGSALVLAH